MTARLYFYLMADAWVTLADQIEEHGERTLHPSETL